MALTAVFSGGGILLGTGRAAAQNRFCRKGYRCNLPNGTCIACGDLPCCEMCCDNCLIDPDIDRDHCGGCNSPCPSKDCKICDHGVCRNACTSLERCQNGQCKPLVSCRDTGGNPSAGSTDAALGVSAVSAKGCGPCETCDPGTGQCIPTGQTYCNGNCVDTQSDPNNCGSCGSTCSGVQTCQSGQCGCPISCNPPQVPNPDTCECECAITCPEGQSPDPATCECRQCSREEILCNGQCVNTVTDPNNCGACGNTCSGAKVCQGGHCDCPNCDYPLVPNPETCECECAISCNPPQVPNPDTCVCECAVSCNPPLILNPDT